MTLTVVNENGTIIKIDFDSEVHAHAPATKSNNYTYKSFRESSSYYTKKNKHLV